MYHLTVSDEWNSIHPSDLWVYNKLNLSQVLGYTCGPAGLEVPKPDFYIIRPSQNFMGMGRFTRIEYLEYDTEHLHPGEFWCEIFKGEHLSIDYYKGTSNLVVRGIRNKQDPFYRWSLWEKVERDLTLPSILKELSERYEWINCEFVDNKLIEVHFRRNPDFRFNNSIAIPIWKDQDIPKIMDKSLKYIEESDYHRRGFIIDAK